MCEWHTCQSKDKSIDLGVVDNRNFAAQLPEVAHALQGLVLSC